MGVVQFYIVGNTYDLGNSLIVRRKPDKYEFTLLLVDVDNQPHKGSNACAVDICSLRKINY